jgi:chaperonin cofactor prefoldin
MNPDLLQFFEEQKYLNDKIKEFRQKLDSLDLEVRINNVLLNELPKRPDISGFCWIKTGFFFEQMDKNAMLVELKNSQIALTKQMNEMRKNFRLYSSKLEELEDLETIQKRFNLGVYLLFFFLISFLIAFVRKGNSSFYL